MLREADMNSAAVKCLRCGVLECVKSKTHDVCAFGSHKFEYTSVCERKQE